LNSGVLVVTDLVLVHVTDVSISEVLLVVHIIQRQSPQQGVVLIVYVLVVFTDVVQESVMDVTDVLHTLMVTT
tara:strand:- start:2279 stop:2497 length:219 start_codon:yes stop_codon:yes gene_type:complete